MNRSQKSELKIVFVDKISLSSLMTLLAFGRTPQTIWHFEPIGRFFRLLVKGLCRLGLLCNQVRQIDRWIGEMRDSAGENVYIKLLSVANSISTSIEREELANDPMIKAMGFELHTDKILLYLSKAIEEKISVECFRICMVEWMMRTQLKVPPTKCFLLVERMKWFRYLHKYSESKGIQIVWYGSSSFWPIVKSLARGFTTFIRKMRGVMGVIRNKSLHSNTEIPRTLRRESSGKQKSGQATIAMRYCFRKLSFNPMERSELFWLEGSGIPYSEVLLYDYVAATPLDNDTLKQINDRGIRILGRAPGIPAWRPTAFMIEVFIQFLTKIIIIVLKSLERGHWVSAYVVKKLVELGIHYAYWYDFYAAHKVVVNIGTLNTHVGQVLALDALNGVSASYQYAVGHIMGSTRMICSGENVQFVFSPVFEGLWRRIEPPADTYVHTGFIYDSAIKKIHSSDRITQFRNKLTLRGARFIICFFDENSIDRWDVLASNERAAEDYEYLLKWLTEDPTLGIIFKPKVSANLYERIGRVKRWIEYAEETGRCSFLISDTHVGSVFPAEAALMADVCIGILAGATAAMEARLAGVPTVLVDREGLKDHPFYDWGDGRIIFEDWDKLRVAVEDFRSHPKKHHRFGDWSAGLKDLDSFQDGKGSLRMGHYISWFYEALKRGKSKETALHMASERFAEQWGRGHVNVGRSTFHKN
jgi:hypothetical protein